MDPTREEIGAVRGRTFVRALLLGIFAWLGFSLLVFLTWLRLAGPRSREVPYEPIVSSLAIGAVLGILALWRAFRGGPVRDAEEEAAAMEARVDDVSRSWNESPPPLADDLPDPAPDEQARSQR